MKNQCPNCGTELSSNATVCPNCGLVITEADTKKNIPKNLGIVGIRPREDFLPQNAEKQDKDIEIQTKPTHRQVEKVQNGKAVQPVKPSQPTQTTQVQQATSKPTGKFCPKCGHRIAPNYDVCPQCGYNLKTKQMPTNAISETKPTKKQTSTPKKKNKTQEKSKKATKNPEKEVLEKLSDKDKKQITTVVSIVAVLVVLVIAFFTWGDVHYSKENQISRITTALKNPKQNLAADVVADKAGMQVTNDSLKPLQRYYQTHPSEANRALDGDNSNFKIKKSGHHWLFFPKYVLQVKTYQPRVTSNRDHVTFYVNNTQASLQELGPFFPGKYNFKAKLRVAGQDLTTSKNTEIWSNKAIKLNFVTQTFKVKGVPNGFVYMNGKQIGVLNKSGNLTLKSYPVTDKMNLQVIQTKNGKKIKSKLVDVKALFKKKKYVVDLTAKTKFDSKAAAKLLANNFKAPKADDFVQGSKNSYYVDLQRVAAAWKSIAGTSNYTVNVQVQNMTLTNAGEYQLNYQIEVALPDGRRQVMQYTGAQIKRDGTEYKINSLGTGTLASQSGFNKK